MSGSAADEPASIRPLRRTAPEEGPEGRDSDEERAEKAYVRARDKDCVARYVVAANRRVVEKGVVSTYPYEKWCDGPLDVDHVRASGGLGMKSPTHRTNMVVLCRHHHRAKTEYGKVWRPLLLAYLERVERHV